MHGGLVHAHACESVKRQQLLSSLDEVFKTGGCTAHDHPPWCFGKVCGAAAPRNVAFDGQVGGVQLQGSGGARVDPQGLCLIFEVNDQTRDIFHRHARCSEA